MLETPVINGLSVFVTNISTQKAPRSSRNGATVRGAAARVAAEQAQPTAAARKIRPAQSWRVLPAATMISKADAVAKQHHYGAALGAHTVQNGVAA
jgi:hypothetical protein